MKKIVKSVLRELPYILAMGYMEGCVIYATAVIAAKICGQ